MKCQTAPIIIAGALLLQTSCRREHSSLPGRFRMGVPRSLPATVRPIPRVELASALDERFRAPLAGEKLHLMWCKVFFPTPKFSGPPVLVTWHALHVSAGHLVRFYVSDGNEYVPAHEVAFGGGWLPEPEYWEEGRLAFLLFRHNSGGSSSDWQHVVVAVGPPYDCRGGCGTIREIEIESPVERLSSVMTERQHSDPGRTYIEPNAGLGLKFSFSIWNEGEHNNFPTGGRVTGTLALQSDETGKPARFVVDRWTYHPPEGAN